MKSLTIFSYVQPLEGRKVRFGIVEGSRDLKRNPLSFATLRSRYRKYDKNFQRSRTIDTVKTREGYKAFYRERTKWRINIPFIGSLLDRLI
jgi:hypothetical protein